MLDRADPGVDRLVDEGRKDLVDRRLSAPRNLEADDPDGGHFVDQSQQALRRQARLHIEESGLPA